MKYKKGGKKDNVLKSKNLKMKSPSRWVTYFRNYGPKWGESLSKHVPLKDIDINFLQPFYFDKKFDF